MNSDCGEIPMKEPMGYFLTWTTYGSWLPGDDRGWCEKPGIFRSPNSGIRRFAEQCLTEPVLVLDTEQREIVEATIKAHCLIRKWQLHAVNARTQHIHVVLTAVGRDPEVVLDQLKAWCTRKLKERERRLNLSGSWIRDNWWTQRGSKRRLYDQTSLDGAVRYVVEDQGDSSSRDLDE